MRHHFSKHIHSPFARVAKQIGMPVGDLARFGAFAVVLALMVGISGTTSPFVSPEMMFTDASSQHLSIVPASGESAPPYVYDGCHPQTGQSCSGSNQCGTLYGTIQCNGACSVGGPTLPVTYGWGCQSSANACGMTNWGTIGCDGSSCNAGRPSDSLCAPPTPDVITPPICTQSPTTATACGQTSTYNPCTGAFNTVGTFDPSIPGCSASGGSSAAGGQCWSAPNACGERTEGVIQGSGLCNASPPPNSCMLPGGGGGSSGSGGWSPSGGGSPIPTYDPIPEPPPPPPPPSFQSFTTTAPGQIFNASGHLQARPTLIRRETITRVYWNVSNVSSCSVTGTNGDAWSGNTSGTSGATTSPLQTRTVYTLRCTSLPGSGAANVNESVTINIAPRFIEQ